MFSIFKKKAAPTEGAPAAVTPVAASAAFQAEPQRHGWLSRLRVGLRKTGNGFANVFVGVRIDDTLYEELEAALLEAPSVGSGVRAEVATILQAIFAQPPHQRALMRLASELRKDAVGFVEEHQHRGDDATLCPVSSD